MESVRQFPFAVGAEALSSGLLAQAGSDVSVDGANQPEYDFISCQDGWFLNSPVLGSQDAGWGENYKESGVGHTEATSLLAKAHSYHRVDSLVQFQHVPLDTCPRVCPPYVAQVATHLKAFPHGTLHYLRTIDRTCVLAVVLLITCEEPAAAYVDPGSGTLLWQILAGGFIGGMFYFRRITRWFRSRLGRRGDSN